MSQRSTILGALPPRQFGSISLALALASGAALALAVVAQARPGGQATRGAPPASLCLVDASQVAHPRALLLGETTAVTLAARGVCAGFSPPVHVVFVVDPSASMPSELVRDLRSYLKTLVTRLNLKDNPGTKIAVVVVEEEARSYAPLTNDVDRILSAIGRIQAGGDTRMELGLREGLEWIVRGRQSAIYPEGLNEIVVVFSDGVNATGCRAAEQAARDVKNHGALVAAVCVGSRCRGDTCLRRVSSSRRYVFLWNEASSLGDILLRLLNTDMWLRLRRMTIVETLPQNMALVSGSADPAPAAISPDGRTLEWTLNWIPVDGVTLTYRIQPQAVGDHEISLGAKVTFDDNLGLGGVAHAVPPRVQVLAPWVVPTATSVAPPVVP